MRPTRLTRPKTTGSRICWVGPTDRIGVPFAMSKRILESPVTAGRFAAIEWPTADCIRGPFEYPDAPHKRKAWLFAGSELAANAQQS